MLAGSCWGVPRGDGVARRGEARREGGAARRAWCRRAASPAGGVQPRNERAFPRLISEALRILAELGPLYQEQAFRFGRVA